MSAPDVVVPLLETLPYHSKSFRAGQLVFAEGDPCHSLYLLESGRVKFYRASAEGREQVMKVFDRPGDTFCIPSAFSTGTHVVSARAVTETRLRVLDVEAVNRLTERYPSVALKLVATAGEHMLHLVSLAEDLSLKTATARLAKHLHELAAAAGAERDEQIQLSRTRLPEEELASMLGTVRVHVSRSLMILVRAGAIELDRSFIRVRDLAVLKQIADGR